MTAKTFTPREYQRLITDRILTSPRCAIWASMGLGKTVATLTALDILTLVETAPTLVLAPKRVALNTWPAEAKKWGHLNNIDVAPVIGSLPQRKAILKRDASIFTMNYDNIPWLVEHYGDKWPFTTIVADESTRLKSFRLRQGGKRAQMLAKIAHCKVNRFVQLTGTPSPNGLQDLWGQMWFLDQGLRLGRSFNAFKDRYFRSIQQGDSRQAIRLEPLPYAQTQINDRLRDLCLSLDARDYFDIKEPIKTTVRVELPAKARQMYKAMEKEMFLALECGAEIEAFNAASKTLKCLQLASGAIYTDDTGAKWAEVHDLKLQALESIVQEAAGMPVLVAYHFKSDLARLQKAFPRGRVLDDNPQTECDWNAGKIPVLFAHPASAGHGLNLQDGGNILVFFSHWWALEEYQQVIERIGPTRQLQSGHDRPVFIYHIVAANTVDEVVMARRESKRSIQDLLLETMKERSKHAA